MATFNDIVKGAPLVLVDFFAEWCGPCKQLAPILQEVKAERTEQVKVLKIDVDKNQKLAANLGIRGVPTMILYKSGEPIWRQSGIVQKQDLLALIDQNA